MIKYKEVRCKMKESDLITGTYEMLEKGVIYDASKIYKGHFHPFFMKKTIIKYYLEW